MRKIEKAYSHWSGPYWTNSSPHPLKEQYGINDHWDKHYRTRTKIDLEKLADKKIVLFVGDSFTFGDGVEYKDTFCNLVQEKYLSDNYYCINVAYRGNPNSKMLLMLKHWLNAFGDQVCAVVCGFSFPGRRMFINDPEDKNLSPYNQHVYDDKTSHQWANLANFNPSVHNGVRNKQLSKAKYNAALSLSNDAQDIFEFERDMLLLKGFSKMYDFRVYWWSWTMHVYNETVNDVIIENICDDDYKYIGFDMKYVPRIPDDGHFDKRGHMIFADVIGYILNEDFNS
jgi:hypothetical protein